MVRNQGEGCINNLIEHSHFKVSKAETALPELVSLSKVRRDAACDAFPIFEGTTRNAFQTGFHRIPFTHLLLVHAALQATV